MLLFAIRYHKSHHTARQPRLSFPERSRLRYQIYLVWLISEQQPRCGLHYQTHKSHAISITPCPDSSTSQFLKSFWTTRWAGSGFAFGWSGTRELIASRSLICGSTLGAMEGSSMPPRWVQSASVVWHFLSGKQNDISKLMFSPVP